MIIQYCSDLHLEFSANLKFIEKNPIKPIGEILIIAGDTIYLEDKYFKLSFFDRISDNFKQVYLIPGNHEYYGGFDISNSYPQLELEVRKNVKMINNVSIEINDYNFIFSTLWSSLRRNVEFISMTMADFHFGKWQRRPFDTDIYEYLYQESLKFISNSLKSSQKKNVVVTHHLPSPAAYNSAIKDSFLTDAYCTDLLTFIQIHSIQYWIYGHCHWNRESFKVGDTELITNQLGYVHKGENELFSLDKFFKL